MTSMPTAAPPSTPASMAESGRGRWIGLAMLSLGVAMIIVDATIVNVSVPAIIKDLDLQATQAEWINTSYALVFAALLVTLGRLGDQRGRRAMYLAGLVIFMVASAIAGLSISGEMLIAARLLQGVGGAMILPSTQSILNTNFRGHDRAIAFGVWGAVIGGMAALGPLLGGWLTTNLSWQWSFYINIPVGILAIAGTLHYIRESRDPHAQAGFDLPGFLLITLGLGAFIFGLIEGNTYGWWTPKQPFGVLGFTWPFDSVSVIPFAIGFGILALLLFAFVEVRRERAGKFFLFDFELWRFPAFRYGNLAGTIVSLGEFGLLFVLPLFLQAVLALSAFDTGVIFLSLAIGAFIAAPIAASLARRYGPRRTVTAGMALEAIGIFVTTLLISSTVVGWQIMLPLFVYGLGVGLATAQLTSVTLSDIPMQKSGLASGANSTMRQVGSALGIAILGTILLVSLDSGVRDRLSAAGTLPPPAVEGIATAMSESAGQALSGLRAQPGSEAVVPLLDDAFVDAARLTGFVAVAFVLLGLGFSLLLPETRGRDVGERAEAAVEAEEPEAAVV
jgi:EmrB/QacA subfamily drug resistance transporter